MLLVVGVSWLAFAPHPPPQATTGWDKANHALAFAALAFVALRGFPGAPAAAAPLALMAYGVLIEVAQAYVPGRSAEAVDLVGDAAGIVIGWLAARTAVARGSPAHGERPRGP